IRLLPDDLLGLQIEAPHAAIGRGVIDAMRLEVSREAAKTFPEDRNVDPPNELVAVVDVEDQDAGARAALLLSPNGRAQIEVMLGGGLAGGESSQQQDDRGAGEDSIHDCGF